MNFDRQIDRDSFSRVQLFVTPQTVARQASLSMEFSRQEYWGQLPFPSMGSSRPRNQTLVSCIAGRFFTVWTTGNKTMEMVIRPVAESDGGEGERDEQVEYTGVLETTLYEIIVEDTSLHIWPDPSAVATGLEKVSFHSNPKECSNYRTIALISHASNVMLKILQPGFNSMWTANFQMFKLDLEKAKEPEIRFPTSVGSKKKQENFRKISTSASLTTLKSLACGSQQTVENSERDVYLWRIHFDIWQK